MRLIYVPIADSFFESSIMQEELSVRFVMLALIRLALRAGANGVVGARMTPADRTGAIREPAAGGRRRPTALLRPLGSLAPLLARIKVPILHKRTW
ncbi:MAG: hypothetical protein ACXWFQ_03515 [Thermoanaerobaculia bacterium]